MTSLLKDKKFVSILGCTQHRIKDKQIRVVLPQNHKPNLSLFSKFLKAFGSPFLKVSQQVFFVYFHGELIISPTNLCLIWFLSHKQSLLRIVPISSSSKWSRVITVHAMSKGIMLCLPHRQGGIVMAPLKIHLTCFLCQGKGRSLILF